MNVETKTNNEITQLLNNWYIEIRNRHVGNAYKLKKDIEKRIQNIEEDQNLLLYYSLIDFGYNYLIDNLSISKNSFDKIDSLGNPTDEFLAYYYHFYKAIHSNAIGNYNAAKENYDKAEKLLGNIPDEIEKAEFYYNQATFHYHFYQALIAIKQVTKAKEIFNKHNGYDLKIGYCNNLLGLACTHLKEWELAEEYFISAMDIFKKQNNENPILVVRQNLGLMYANQNLSELAIRYLTEVCEKMPNNYKAIFVKAKEHSKIDENEIASKLIEKGLNISNELGIIEYQYRFKIIKAINEKVPAKTLENAILEGMNYFKTEELWEYIQEYNERVAVLFHQENNFEKASKYFYLSHQAKEEISKKEGLK